MDRRHSASRRRFVRAVAGTVALAGATGTIGPMRLLGGGDTSLPKRPLGRTGHDVGIFSLGGQATLEKEGTRDASIAIIERAIDAGVNYIDTAAAYGRGLSEQYIGEVMRTRRKEVYLATKTGDRSYDGSMRLLEKSLRQLQTDRLDAWQLHNVRSREDLEKIFAPDGAIRALQEARDQKVVRFLGITGHRDPFVLREAIERYPFDTILMALNAADRHNASFIDNLLPAAVERGMGIIAMKVPARGRIFREGGLRTMEQAMRYVLTLPVSTAIVGISTMEELEENLAIARRFDPCSPAEMAQMEELTRPYYADASWFKTQW